ncbi:FG-GAP repeat domain-containing protein [Fontivita pretiosa]|uniref:FG-GAP repeat domain-containing protein n=1 Tax=Fontivita pretiosa TaxID=2989684 RepID=UPI003D162E62
MTRSPLSRAATVRLELLERRVFLDAAGTATVLSFRPPIHSLVGTSSVLGSADFNRDHIPDLVSAARGQDYGQVLYGTGDGRFNPPMIAVVLPTGPAVTAVATGDFTSDGIPDAVFANNPANRNSTVTLLNGRNLFAGARSFWVGAAPTSLAVADFNHDANLDLLIAHAAPWTPQFSLAPPRYGAGLLLGNGDGTFRPEQLVPTFGPQTHVAVADVTGDGLVDAVFGGSPPDYLDIPDQRFLFTVMGSKDDVYRVTTSRLFYGEMTGLALGDMNRDGRADVAAIETPLSGLSSSGTWPGESGAWVLLSNGDGSYVASANVPTLIGNPAGASLADFDRDGRLDLAVGGDHVLPTMDPLPPGAVSILRGARAGQLHPPILFRTIYVPQVQLTIDANLDGRADIITGHAQGVTALLNATPARPIRELTLTSIATIEQDILTIAFA